MSAAAAKRSLAAAGSDPGRARDNNEDRVLCDPERGIYAVIDGVGGESGGEIAAQTALEILQARLSRRTTDDARLIREAIALANKQIWEQAQANPALAGMACVLTVAVVDGAQATIGHVGDSRLYLLRRGRDPQDHPRPLPRRHPRGRRRDLGERGDGATRGATRSSATSARPPTSRTRKGSSTSPASPSTPDAALLLCSDGLSDLVTVAGDPAPRSRRTPPTRSAAVQALIDAANQAGGKDNVSAVLVEGERFAAAVRKQPAAAGARRGRRSTARGP